MIIIHLSWLFKADRQQRLGVPSIIEWHFNVPEYKDSRIIAHAEAKRQEILSTKTETPDKYTHIADKFHIIIKTAVHFTPEKSRIIRTNLTDMQLNLAIKHTDIPDWTKCDSQKANNIRRKIKAVMHVNDDNNQDLNAIINLYIKYYISGMENMHRLQVAFPEIYEDLYRLEQSYKNEVFLNTHMNIDHTMNQTLFGSILNEFQAKLEKDFSKVFDLGSIGELKQDLIASWLADCSMEFRSAQ